MKVTCIYTKHGMGWSDDSEGFSFIMISQAGMPIIKGGIENPRMDEHNEAWAYLRANYRCYDGDLYVLEQKKTYNNFFMKQAAVEQLLRDAVKRIREEDIIITNFVEL